MTAPYFNYASIAIFAGGASPYSSAFESIATASLEGIQSSEMALDYPRMELFGWDGAGDQELVEPPRANLSFSYVFVSGLTEQRIGLAIGYNNSTPALSNINAERNYYVLYNETKQDAIGYLGTASKVMAFGNGVLNKYDFNAAVGQPSTVSASVGGLNLFLQPGSSGQPLPSVFKQSGTFPTGTYTLPPAQALVSNYFESVPASMVLTFDTGCAFGTTLSGQNACPVKSFSFSIDIPRQEIKSVGWAYPDTRSAQWPIAISIHAAATLNAFQVDALNRFGCPDSGYSFGLRFNNGCGATDTLSFQFADAKLAQQQFTSQIGALTEVTFDWTLKIYDINRPSPNFFINQSGQYYTSVIFPQVEYVTGSSPLTINLGTACYLSVLSGPAVLSGNAVFVADLPETVIVRSVAIDGSDTQDITVTVA